MLKFSLRTAATLVLAAGLPAQVGSLVGTLTPPTGASPVGLGVTPQGDLLMTDTTGNAYRMTVQGTVLQQFSVSTDTQTPAGITSDGTNFFITDASRFTGGLGVDVYDLQGTYVRGFVVVGARGPAGICFNPLNNHLYMMDRIVGVLELDLQGTVLNTFTLPGATNDGIAFDPSTNSFWVYEVTGDLVHNFDAQFTSLSSFPGTLAALNEAGRGLAFIGGRVYVALQVQQAIAIFDTTGTGAVTTLYGTGCPQPGLFYELFTDSAGANPADVGGRAFTFTATGSTGWFATAGGTFEPNIGPGLNHGDDQIDRALALGFTFPIPGAAVGSTTAIDVSSNGWIGLEPNAIPDSGFYVGDTARLTTFPNHPRIAAWWTDLDPSNAAYASGDTHFNTLTNPTRAVVTWNQVVRFGAAPPDVSTFQVQLFPSGNWVIVYQQGCTESALTGFSGGGDPADPGSTDLTGVIPTQFGPYGLPLQLTSNRPLLGTTVNYQLGNIPNGSALGALIFGIGQTSQSLDPINMTGCTLLSTGDLATAPVNLTTGVFPFLVPNQPALIGGTLYHQAFVVVGGFNPFGVIASNGLSLRLGNN